MNRWVMPHGSPPRYKHYQTIVQCTLQVGTNFLFFPGMEFSGPIIFNAITIELPFVFKT
jgi:hypothetical protein